MNRFNKLLALNKFAASAQQIVNLGYPEVIAKVFIERFGKNAFIIAKWMNEYHLWGVNKIPMDWIRNVGRLRGEGLLANLLQMLDAALKGEDAYDKWSKENGYSGIESYDPYSQETRRIDLEEHIPLIKKEIKEIFLKDIFFDRDLIRDIVSGEVNNLNQYKKLSYKEAAEIYADKKISLEMPTIKQYVNGYRWIDSGKKCDILGQKMKNCGSVGAMGIDEDRTMLILLDKNQNPHIVATYHPNEKRISSIEGAGSSPAKADYHKYIIDLIEDLGVNYEDRGSPKSKLLKLKYDLKDLKPDILKIPVDSLFDEYFIVKINDEIYYTNGAIFLSEADAKLIEKSLRENQKYIENKLNFSDKENPSELVFEDFLGGIFPSDRFKRKDLYDELGVAPAFLNKAKSGLSEKLKTLESWALSNGLKKESLAISKLYHSKGL
jgi:hypothetical protein